MALTKSANRMQSSSSVSVIDYGAVGDGVTDCTSAIQAAIDAVFASGGGTVVFPVGHYIITSALEMKSAVRLEGQGQGRRHYREATIVEQTTSNTACVNAGTPHDESAGTSDYRFNIGIDNMTFWAVVDAAQTAAVLYFGGVVYSSFNNLVVYGGGYGIHMGSSFMNSYRQVDVVGSAKACFYFNGRAADNSFVTCSTNRSITDATVTPEASLRFAGTPDSLSRYYQVPAGNIFTKCDFTRTTWIIDFENELCGGGNVFEATYFELSNGVRIQDNALFNFTGFSNNKILFDLGLTAQQKKWLRVRNFVRDVYPQSAKGVAGYNGLLDRNKNGQRFIDANKSVDTDRFWTSMDGSFVLNAASAAKVEYCGNGLTDTTTFDGPYSIGSPHCVKVTANLPSGSKLGPVQSDSYLILPKNKDYLFNFWYKPASVGAGSAPFPRIYRSFSTLKTGLSGDVSLNEWQNLGVLLRSSDFNEGDALLPIAFFGSSASVSYVADLSVREINIENEKQTFVSQAIDLSGSAFSDALIGLPINCVITSIRVVYTEASSADAGVTINVGNQSSATAFATTTSLTSQALGSQTELLTTEKYARKNDMVVVACAGGKTGAGAIKVIVDYVPMTSQRN